ncbi:LysM domain-containing protein [Candidatus Electrothrix marina]|uniref:LysM domain-containing protein n=2 Tax=Candidatus Electrothrix marina TaxID=1859130 RepID=A0A444JG55_9BACT|nr:LysM domain-containing protein [Candidatus Electrothrix marina]
MKVSLFVPLVSLPFFAACSPAVHNTDPLKNINQEEVTVRSFSAEKNSEETEGVNLKKVSAPPQLAERTITERTTAGRTVVSNVRRKGTGIQQAVVVYSSELVPIIEVDVEVKEKGIETESPESPEAEEIRKAGREPRSFSSLAVLKQRNSSSTRFLPAISYSAAGKEPQEPDDLPPVYIPVQSEQELKEELTALEKTGDWSDSGAGKQDALSSYGIQCDLPESITPVRVNLDVDFLSSVAKGKDAVQPEQHRKKAECDFPVVINKQVEFYLDQFQNRQRTTFRRWLKRAALYLPVIEKELKKAELPRSLAYLAMIESGFNPAAYSPAHASGLWQFIPGTARYYGLRIDSWVDERRDSEKATQAAVSYLDALYKRFGDWQLAVAAYNAGEGKIQRGLEQHKAKNFWELAAKDYLPLETKRYVPKLIAAIIIAHDPERYGFQPVPEKNEQYDVVEVPSQTPLSAIAAAGGCSVKKLRQLNTELLKNQVPPTEDVYSIKVPAGSSLRIAANLEQTRADEERKIVHRLSRGETLSGVGKQYNVSVDMIMQWNNIDDVRRIRAGRKLALYPDGKFDTGSDKSEQRTVSYYKVRNGDSLWSIARKHQVSTREIKRWNSLSNNLLHPGKKLVIKKS